MGIEGHRIYADALRSYGYLENNIQTQPDFMNMVRKLDASGGFEPWGAFVDGKMAAYSGCIVLQGAVSLGTTKSDPDTHAHNPNAALFYTLTHHYLHERKMDYVTNGSRTLLHPSNINEFLENCGFRKVYARLNLELSSVARAVDKVHLDTWAGAVGVPKLLPAVWSKLQGFRSMMNIADTFRS
jgi:hypothetical protein